eukprot:TRINITY_DN10051_c0_g1_i2.p1 TRINITY_DN10051_c0_g1~~TRINITY_DN10051_c0_g1_i2.p1  ORF type:complete len:432 (-),score=94.36 TRINITY_DN10051_c0_g1_i2:221-1516(-)
MRSIMQVESLHALYIALTELYQVFGWQGVEQTIPGILDAILNDIQLQLWKYDSDEETKSKKLKSIADLQVSQITKDEHFRIATASLSVLEIAYRKSGGFMPVDVTKRVEVIILKQLLLVTSKKDGFPECYTLGLYRVLFELLLAPSTVQPTCLNIAMKLFQQGIRLPSVEVNRLCLDSIRVMEIFLHPRAAHRVPPTFLSDITSNRSASMLETQPSSFSFDSASNRMLAMQFTLREPQQSAPVDMSVRHEAPLSTPSFTWSQVRSSAPEVTRDESSASLKPHAELIVGSKQAPSSIAMVHDTPTHPENQHKSHHILEKSNVDKGYMQTKPAADIAQLVFEDRPIAMASQDFSLPKLSDDSLRTDTSKIEGEEQDAAELQEIDAPIFPVITSQTLDIPQRKAVLSAKHNILSVGDDEDDAFPEIDMEDPDDN